jgi:predicted extracellular nuclease
MRSKRFNLSKVLLTFMFMVLSAVVLVACGDTDQDLVDQALETVAVTFSSGDTQDSVTKNLILPETIGDITVSWSSSNTAVISNAGVVTRPEADTEVTLTATLTLGDVSETFSATVTVIAEEVVVDPLDALAAIEFEGRIYMEESVYIVTSSFDLPETSMGLDITWQTSNADFIALDGSVNRPYFGEADQVVTLTATIDGEEAQFLMKVLAFTTKPISQKLEEAKTALLLDGISGGVAVDLDLPATVGTDGVSVTWSSSNPEVLANDGMVTRPTLDQGDTSVTLTATLFLESRLLTKTFDVIVLALPVNPTLYTSIADVFANAEAGDYIRLEDVTVIAKTSNEFFFADSTGMMPVYNGDLDRVEVGSVYNIYGLYDVYFGSAQLNATSDSSLPTVARPSDGAVTVLTPTIVDDITAFTPNTAPSYGDDNMFVNEYLQITAKVLVQGDGSYDTVFVNADYDGDPISTLANSPYSNEAFMIYYKSNKAAFDDLDGEVVRFNAILYGYRSDRTIYTIIFTGEAADIESSEDITAVALAKLSLRGTFENEYIENATLTLPVVHDTTTTIAWETDSTLVDTTTGALTMPATDYEEITLTATITSGDEVGTFTATFMVGDLPNNDILDARALEGHLVKVTGVLTASEYYRAFFIQDATSGIEIYTRDSAFTAFLKANVGKEVTILGEVENNYGLIRFNNVSSYTLVGDGTMPTAVNVDEFELTGAAMLPFQGLLVELNNLFVSNVAVDNYGNITLTLERPAEGTKVMMKYDSRADLTPEALLAIEAIQVGDVINVTTPLSWDTYGNAPFLYYTSSTLLGTGTLSAADELAIDASALEFDAKMMDARTLTLPVTGTYGSTIAWSSSDSALIDVTTGAVVMPAEGLATVTLTATLTKGDAEVVVEFMITVGVSTISGATDLFFSEYIEGSVGNNKAVEIYNGTGANVDLTGYVVNQYSNGNTSVGNSVALEGILYNGDVLVIYNSGAGEEILAEGDVASSITYFNGNDPLELVKDGVVIDVIGEVGVDTVWVVGDGSTQDNTLVRKSTVYSPNAVFDPTEWEVYPANTYDYIGSHVMIDNSEPDLFISEYVEGTPGNRKAIEIFNPSDQPIVLTGVYTLARNGNADQTWGDPIVLEGTIAAGDVFVVYYDDSELDDKLAPFGDLETSALNFNGDDAMGLFKNGVLIDLFGVFGEDPGAGWDMGDTVEATKDHVITRNPSVTAPSAIWVISEWTVVEAYTDGSVTTLGAHTVD